MRGGEQLDTGHCPGLARVAGNSSWVSLAEPSCNMSQNGFVEDVGEYIRGGASKRAPWSEVIRGPSPSTWVPMALTTVCGPQLVPEGRGMVEGQLTLPGTLSGLMDLGRQALPSPGLCSA